MELRDHLSVDQDSAPFTILCSINLAAEKDMSRGDFLMLHLIWEILFQAVSDGELEV